MLVSQFTQSLQIYFTCLHTYMCTQNWHTHLTPGPCFPLGWAGHSVTGPAALGTVTHAVLAVHGAVGAVVEGLEAAHGAQLVAGTPTGFGAMLPLVCCPAVGMGVKIEHGHWDVACASSCTASLDGSARWVTCSQWGTRQYREPFQKDGCIEQLKSLRAV